MPHEKILQLPKRGQRLYIHGPDLMNCLLAFCKNNYQDTCFYNLTFSAHQLIKGTFKVFEVDSIAEVKKAHAFLKYKNAEGQLRLVALVEISDEYTVSAIEYNEDGLVSKANINDQGECQLDCHLTKSITALHYVVALNKAMLNKLVQPKCGKWIFAKFTSKKLHLQDLSALNSLRVTFKGEFNGALYKSEVGGLGDIFFYLNKDT